MKCAIVKASAIAKHGRMDADYYLGMVEGRDHDERIAFYRGRVQSAAVKLEEACDAKIEDTARVTRMIQDGEIIPITEKRHDSAGSGARRRLTRAEFLESRKG